LQPVCNDLAKFLGRKVVSRRGEHGGKKVLYLVKKKSNCEIPHAVLGAHIFLSAYLYAEEERLYAIPHGKQL